MSCCLMAGEHRDVAEEADGRAGGGTGTAALEEAECYPIESASRQHRTATGPYQGGRCEGINWKGLIRDSFFFTGVQHAFRIATEPATRAGLKGPFFRDYLQSVANMHGWADQDPFYVNYVGHPMQGAVSGYIWVNNDLRYSSVTLSKHPDYWKSRLRAAAFMWVYSTQFEVGPLSEASVGNIQRYYPQQGYVDHVITPAVGLLWMIGEDTLDRYIITPFENRVRSPAARLIVRGVLNPSRTFANVMSFRLPQNRDDRLGIYEYRGNNPSHRVAPRRRIPANPPPGAPPVEFATVFQSAAMRNSGGVSCQGGGGELAVRLARSWQGVAQVGACNLDGLRVTNRSGDGLFYFFGPRWTPRAGERWTSYFQVMAGGAKFTVEEADEEKRRRAHEIAAKTNTRPDFSSFATLDESHGLAVSAGGGVDIKLNSVVALRAGSLEYRRGWFRPVTGYPMARGLQFSTGLVLRMGTW